TSNVGRTLPARRIRSPGAGRRFGPGPCETPPMRYGIDLAQQRMPFAEVVTRARFADEAGFDALFGFDHFQPMYGTGPGECFEGNTTLAALSGRTERVRLGL